MGIFCKEMLNELDANLQSDQTNPRPIKAIIPEINITNHSLHPIEKIIKDAAKSLCKIFIFPNKRGSGFLIKL